MDIEIVEFYLEQQDSSKKTLKGTLHIYLPTHDIDIRGVIVSRRKDFWFFGLPSKLGSNQETGKKLNIQYLHLQIARRWENCFRI